jgi:hypothetical protein
MPEPVQVNKWARFGLTMLAGLLTLLAAFDWTNLFDKKTAALVGLAVLAIKGVIDVLAPAAGTPTAPVPGATSTSLITHRAVDESSAPLQKAV